MGPARRASHHYIGTIFGASRSQPRQLAHLLGQAGVVAHEHQGIHGLILVRWRHGPCHGQMGQECFNLSCAILAILPVGDCVIVRIAPDLGAIGPFGMDRIRVEAEHLPHVVQQSRLSGR